jgi:hypothetical protein
MHTKYKRSSTVERLYIYVCVCVCVYRRCQKMYTYFNDVIYVLCVYIFWHILYI